MALKQIQELDILEQYLSHEPANAKVTSEKLLANYLDCSGMANADENKCLEYLACIYSKPQSQVNCEENNSGKKIKGGPLN